MLKGSVFATRTLNPSFRVLAILILTLPSPVFIQAREVAPRPLRASSSPWELRSARLSQRAAEEPDSQEPGGLSDDPETSASVAMLVGCTGLPDGTSCDDGDPCTINETCRAEVCTRPATFTSSNTATVGSVPRSVVAGDWTSDGQPDLVVANGAANTIQLLRGVGNGSFTISDPAVSVGSNNPYALTVSDVNNDGLEDLAVANRGSNNVTVLTFNGSSFTVAGTVTVGTNPLSIAAGDLNNDGSSDLAVANSGSNDVTILLGNGTGGFSAAVGSPVAVGGTAPASVAIGDVNRDGKLDLAVANQGSNNVTILLGNGSGGFSAAAGSPFAAATGPLSIAVGDLDGDGDLDLAAANKTSVNVTILLGDGSGGFSPAAGSPVALATSPNFLSMGDVNDDGRIDLAVAQSDATNSNVAILIGSGTGRFAPAGGSPITTGTIPDFLVLMDANSDGKMDLASTNFGSNNVSVLLNGTAFASNGTSCADADPCTTGETCRSGRCTAPVAFAQPLGSPVALGTQPHAITTGDFDRNGTLDLAAALSPQSIVIMLGNGLGAFHAAPGSPFFVNAYPEAIAAGDLNRDGILDLAVGTSDDKVESFLGNGFGGFSHTGSIPVGSGPALISMGDLDRDGDLDLAVANVGQPSFSTFSILLGNGSGGFSAAPGSPISLSNISDAAMADVSGDGKLDLLAMRPNNLTVLLGNGSGGFSTGATVPVVNPRGFAVADLNADAVLDLAVMSDRQPDPGRISILLGDGRGGFINAVGLEITAVVPAVGVAPVARDVNRDGAIDLIVLDEHSLTRFLLGDRSGRFVLAPGSLPASGSFKDTVTPGDFNADGKLDVVLTGLFEDSMVVQINNAVCERANCATPAFAQPSGSPLSTPGSVRSIVSGDFNGDGQMDLVVAGQTANTVSILLGDSTGRFSPALGSPVTVGSSPQSVAATDLNRDGKLDLAVANQLGNSVTILLGNGRGGFSQAAGSPVAAGTGPISVTAGDWNRNGKLDLAVALTSNTVTLLTGDGVGGFSAGGSLSVTGAPQSITSGDWNGDGKADLAVAAQSSDNVAIFLGDGAGGFTAGNPSPVSVGDSPRFIAAGDVNRDGREDLAVANFLSNDVTILLGNGSGGFSQAAGSPVAAGLRPFALSLADLSGDSNLDLAVSDNSGAAVTILIGNGSGGFNPSPGSPVPIGTAPSVIAASDLNGDGSLDLAAGNNTTGTNLKILLAGQGAAAADGIGCDDKNTCTGSDACTGGFCGGPLLVPAEVDNGVRVMRDTNTTNTISWNLASGASSSDLLKGRLSGLPVGPGNGQSDEFCFSGLQTLSYTDGGNPAVGTGFWYLVRGKNVCGGGPYGFQAVNGVPTVPRNTTTCP